MLRRRGVLNHRFLNRQLTSSRATLTPWQTLFFDCGEEIASSAVHPLGTFLAHRVVPPVYVVTHEQIVGVRSLATNTEELYEVVKLAVNVPADRDRAGYRLDVRFFQEHIAGLR